VYDASSKLIAEYSNQTPENPNTSYVATDTLLSVRLVTDRNGNVVSRRDFKPFGEELTADGSARKSADKYSTATENKVRQRFTGYLKDIETGLDFAEARMYENRHGRFTAVDPLLASGKNANPQTFNRYTYVLNSPLVKTDPTGLQTAQNPAVGARNLTEGCGVPPCRDVGIKMSDPSGERNPDGTKTSIVQLFQPIAEVTIEAELGPEPDPIVAPFLESFDQAARDKTNGMFKGASNFGAGIWNMATTPGGPLGEMMFGLSSPVSVGYYGYSNPREAGWSFATQTGLTIGTTAFGGSAIPRGSSSIFGLSSEGTGAGTVLVDSNVVPRLSKNPTLDGMISAGETPYVSYVTRPELRNVVARPGGLRGVPKVLDNLNVLTRRPSLNLRINIRGELPKGSGNFGDGIIGAQAIENGIPLITSDVNLAGAVVRFGGRVRVLQ